MTTELQLKQLLDDLRHSNSEQKLSAVKSLVEYQETTIQPVIDLIINTEPNLIKDALDGLWTVGLSIHEEFISKDGFQLLTGATDWNAWFVVGCLEVLGQIGEPAVDKLVKLLEHPTHWVQCWAALTLGKTRSLRAAEVLRKTVQPDKLDLAKSCVLALGELKDKENIAVLTSLLNTSDNDLRESVLIALEQIADPHTIDAIIPMLKHEDCGTRMNAVAALGNIADARAVPALIELLRQCGHEIYSITAALYKIGTSSIQPLIELLYDPEVEKIHDLIIMSISFYDYGGDAVIEPIKDMLDRPNSQVRQFAITALGRLKAKSAVKLLIQQFESIKETKSYSSTLGGIARSLGQIGTNEAVDYLIGLCDHPNKFVRHAAVFGLGNAVASEAAVVGLIAILESGIPDVKSTAAGALGNLRNTQAVEPLINALDDPDPTVQQYAASALAKIGGEHIKEVFQEVILHHPNEYVRQEAKRFYDQYRSDNLG